MGIPTFRSRFAPSAGSVGGGRRLGRRPSSQHRGRDRLARASHGRNQVYSPPQGWMEENSTGKLPGPSVHNVCHAELRRWAPAGPPAVLARTSLLRNPSLPHRAHPETSKAGRGDVVGFQ